MPELSPADLIPALLLLAPGFLALLLLRRVRGIRAESGSLSWTLGSLAISGTILAVFVAVHQIGSPQGFEDFLFHHPLRTFFEVSALAIAAAVLLSILALADFVTRFVHWVIYGEGAKPINSETWDTFMARSIRKPIQVTTRDGATFKGILVQHSTADEQKAVRLNVVKRVFYDEKNAVDDEADWGEELLLFGDDIVRVARLPGGPWPIDAEPPMQGWSRLRQIIFQP